MGGQFLGSQLMATRVVAIIFMAAVVLLAFSPEKTRKTSTALCRRSEKTAIGYRLSAIGYRLSAFRLVFISDEVLSACTKILRLRLRMT